MSEQMLERKSIAAAVHQIFPGESMTKNDLLAFKIHIAVLDIPNCTRSTTAIHKEIDNDPVAIFAEITVARWLLEQKHQFRVRVGFFYGFLVLVICHFQLRVARFSRPVQERAEYPQITADGVMSQPALTHGSDHIVQILFCEGGERGGEIQVLFEGMKMRIVVLNGLIADPFCGLRRNEAFKNLRDSLVVGLSK